MEIRRKQERHQQGNDWWNSRGLYMSTSSLASDPQRIQRACPRVCPSPFPALSSRWTFRTPSVCKTELLKQWCLTRSVTVTEWIAPPVTRRHHRPVCILWVCLKDGEGKEMNTDSHQAGLETRVISITSLPKQQRFRVTTRLTMRMGRKENRIRKINKY